MKSSRFAAFLAVLLALAGCGKTVTHTVTPTVKAALFVCHHRVPAQAGECIRQELEYDHVKPATPRLGITLGARIDAQGIDISRYQPHPAFRELYREGIRFVIVQGADDCSESNPFFDSQVRSAHEADMKVGVYVFAEGCEAGGQAAALERAAASERSRITLGAQVDAEVPAAYPRACAIVADLSRHFHIVGVYGSPGTYRGGRCIGVIWPAEWGRGAAYPLPGYPVSAIKVRQQCGTCRLAGNDGEIDRDEDLGLLALAHTPSKPKPKPPAPTKSELDALLGAYSKRNPHGHDCQKPPYHHAYSSARFDHACAVWAHEVNQLKGTGS